MDTENQKEAWVLWWDYGDGSGGAVLRVYTDEQRAKEDFEIAKEDINKEWKLDKVPFFPHGDKV